MVGETLPATDDVCPPGGGGPVFWALQGMSLWFTALQGLPTSRRFEGGVMSCPDCPACRADLAAIAERAANARALIAEALTVLATAYVDADLVLDGHTHHAPIEQATP